MGIFFNAGRSRANCSRSCAVLSANAWRRRDLGEVAGQIPRILLAAPGTWLGRAPVGNTGGAAVGIFQPMPIAEDLQRILDAD